MNVVVLLLLRRDLVSLILDLGRSHPLLGDLSALWLLELLFHDSAAVSRGGVLAGTLECWTTMIVRTGSDVGLVQVVGAGVMVGGLWVLRILRGMDRVPQLTLSGFRAIEHLAKGAEVRGVTASGDVVVESSGLYDLNLVSEAFSVILRVVN